MAKGKNYLVRTIDINYCINTVRVGDKKTSVKVFISKTELFCVQFLTLHNLLSVGTVYKLYIFCNHVFKKTLKKNEK